MAHWCLCCNHKELCYEWGRALCGEACLHSLLKLAKQGVAEATTRFVGELKAYTLHHACGGLHYVTKPPPPTGDVRAPAFASPFRPCVVPSEQWRESHDRQVKAATIDRSINRSKHEHSHGNTAVVGARRGERCPRRRSGAPHRQGRFGKHSPRRAPAAQRSLQSALRSRPPAGQAGGCLHPVRKGVPGDGLRAAVGGAGGRAAGAGNPCRRPPTVSSSSSAAAAAPITITTRAPGALRLAVLARWRDPSRQPARVCRLRRPRRQAGQLAPGLGAGAEHHGVPRRRADCRGGRGRLPGRREGGAVRPAPQVWARRVRAWQPWWVRVRRSCWQPGAAKRWGLGTPSAQLPPPTMYCCMLVTDETQRIISCVLHFNPSYGHCRSVAAGSRLYIAAGPR